jgi:hypothetical protein
LEILKTMFNWQKYYPFGIFSILSTLKYCCLTQAFAIFQSFYNMIWFFLCNNWKWNIKNSFFYTSFLAWNLRGLACIQLIFKPFN